MAKKLTFETRDPLEAGPNHGVIFAVNDAGMMDTFDHKDKKWHYAVGLEFPEYANGNGIPRKQWILVGASTHPKSKMIQLLTAAGITMKSGDSIDPSELIGRNITVMVEHVERNGATYGNLVGFSKLRKDAEVRKPVNDPKSPMPRWMKAKAEGEDEAVEEGEI